MSVAIRSAPTALIGIFALVATTVASFAQAPATNPYRPVRGLADGGGPSPELVSRPKMRHHGWVSKPGADAGNTRADPS